MASVDISDVVSSFGNFYRQEGQGMQDIQKGLLVPAETEKRFGLIPTVETQKRKVFADITGTVFQKFQKQLSSSGAFVMTPQTIELQDAKYEVKLEDLDDLEESYLGFLADDTNDRSQWPFVKWLVREMAIAKGAQDFELNEVYAGNYTSITTPGTANAAGLNFVGLKKLLQGFDSASSMNVVAMGTLETDPQAFYEQFNAWIALCKEGSALHRRMITSMVDEIHMAPELAERYADGKDKALNLNYLRSADVDQKAIMEVSVPRTGIKIVGLDSMIGDEGVYMTMKANRAAYIKRPKSAQEFGINMANPYAPILYLKFWKGIGFWFPQYIWANENYGS